MKKLAKLFLSGIIAGSMMLGTVGVFANNQTVKVKIGSNVANVNGQNVTMDAVPYIQQYTNVTMIPLRFVATALGIPDSNVIYNADTRSVKIITDEKDIIYFLNQHMRNYGYAEIKNGRTYIPLRVLCDNLGLSVEWDNVTKTATMISNVSLVNNSNNNMANSNLNNNVSNNNVNNSTTNSTTPAEQEIREMEEEVVKLVNEERVKNGLQPLQIKEDLMQSARAKSEDMAIKNYSDHTDPQGYTMYKELNVGENIFFGASQPHNAISWWLNSDLHRANILNPNYKYIGVGYAKNSNSDYTYYWTQHFSY